jgi:hypothetical protein
MANNMVVYLVRITKETCRMLTKNQDKGIGPKLIIIKKATTLGSVRNMGPHGLTASGDFFDYSQNLVLGMELVPHGSPSSAITKRFRGKDFTTGVVNLYGCTSVIIVSDNTLYLSHFWEARSSIDEHEPGKWDHVTKRFEEDVLETVKERKRFKYRTNRVKHGKLSSAKISLQQK